MLSAAMMLRHLGEADPAEQLEQAVTATIAAGDVTADLAVAGVTPLGTRAFTDAVLGRLSSFVR
jgi:isocitrate dehydrogenase